MNLSTFQAGWISGFKENFAGVQMVGKIETNGLNKPNCNHFERYLSISRAGKILPKAPYLRSCLLTREPMARIFKQYG